MAKIEREFGPRTCRLLVPLFVGAFISVMWIINYMLTEATLMTEPIVASTYIRWKKARYVSYYTG